MGAIVNVRDKLVKLIPMLGSSIPHEVTATAQAITRVLQSEGLGWHDLASALVGSPPALPTAPPRRAPPKRSEWKESVAGNAYFKYGEFICTVFKNRTFTHRSDGKWSIIVVNKAGAKHYVNDFISEEDAKEHAYANIEKLVLEV